MPPLPFNGPWPAVLLAAVAAILLAAWLNARRLRLRNAELVRLAEARAAALEAALKETRSADAAKGAFLAVVSHELRTPIHAILGLSGLMLEEGLAREQRERLQSVQRASRGLLAMLNDILDFSKLETGKVAIRSTPFDLEALVGDLVDLHSVTAQEKGLELVLRWDAEEGLALLGDPDRLRQVLMNLLGNALKFTSEGHVLLRVEAQAQAGRVALRLAVSDTGPGIALDKQGGIFEPFTQEDTSITRRFGGTGLGLAISRTLAEAMGARLSFQSEPGQGSTFWLELELPRAGTSADLPPPREAPLRVLVVDGLAAQREALGALLARWGMPWSGAATAQEALMQLVASDFQAEGFDLVLASEAAGLDPRATELPTVALLPMHRPCDAGALAARGYLGLLRKPVLPWELRELLEQDVKGGHGWVYPPLQEDAPAAPPPEATLRILVAEDNPLHRQVALRLLERLGAAVDLAAHGGEALELARAGVYDVVFLDAQMPVMDGLGTAAALRGQGCAAPLVAMTAHALEVDRDRFLEAGMAAFLPKPFGRTEVVALLETLLPAWRPPMLPDPSGLEEGADSGSPLDRRRLLAEERVSPGATRELLALYCMHAPGRMAALRRALKDGDRAAARDAVHGLAGSAACIHAEPLADACRALESGLTGADAPAGNVDLEAVERAYRAVWEGVERLAADL